MTEAKLEPLDGTEWEEIAEESWFCGVYRYRFDCEALVRKNENSRFEWAIRLITDASGEPEREEAGTYAGIARANTKIQSLFAEFMQLPSVQDPEVLAAKATEDAAKTEAAPQE